MNNIQTKEQKMRRRIINKAFNLMSRKGIDAVSMREIAQHIGVTKPVLYYYFKNKEDLCKSIIGEGVADFNKVLIERYKNGGSLHELATLAIRTHKEFFLKDKKNASFVLHLLSYSLNGKKGSQTFFRVKSERKKLFDGLLSRAERDGVIPKGSGGDIVHLISAVIAHFILNSYNFEFSFDKDFSQRMTDIIFLGVREYYKNK
ncbi:MAG: TetR/AcrR family transcriptional regulator [Elusimicrobium sp.]|jgi:AcrR family transcriptional regulator|nr:TetR/AcrR family transcriptional regulator [Elusimicrobium sp.]